MNQIPKDELEEFVLTCDGFFGLSLTEQIDHFVYFLTVIRENTSTQAIPIKECFLTLDLSPYSNISQYLNANLKGKGKVLPKYLKIKDGFQLHRERKMAIQNSLSKKPLKTKVSKDLKSLLVHVSSPNENEFLQEAINCFEIGAYRASVVMVWNLTIDHLFNYVINHKLTDFNVPLSKNTDKRIKISSVTKKDDFSEIPEGKFIEFCKSGNIINNDVRKILDTKLGIRNSYAHPSSLKMTESKAIEFIEDLVNNIIFKFRI